MEPIGVHKAPPLYRVIAKCPVYGNFVKHLYISVGKKTKMYICLYVCVYDVYVYEASRDFAKSPHYGGLMKPLGTLQSLL